MKNEAMEKRLSSDLYHVRVLDKGRVQFGVKAFFDRWYNSVDFIFDGIPQDEKQERKIKATVERLIAEGLYDKGLAKGLVINQAVGKEKQ